ncbi:MAG: hypothetical protein HPY50_04535 [Firmicutes bacterium]|nr:hypothetical protein [Bacillota bacterium]
MFTDTERVKRIQQMVDEIGYLVTKPHFPDREHDLIYALEVMTKAVGLFTEGDEAPHNLELIENNVAQAYRVTVQKHAENDYVTLPSWILGD